MKNTLRTLSTLAVTTVVVVLGALPVLATEAPDEKWQVFTRSPHSTVGGFILLAFALIVAGAVVNAIQQLRGKRKQADGKFRWR